LRLAAIYASGGILLGVGGFVGLLGPVVRSTGWVSEVIFALVVTHAVCSFSIVRGLNAMGSDRTAFGMVSWLEKLDASILAIGFLGKLYGIAQVLNGVVTTGDPAAAAAGLGAVAHGVAVALYSTMFGLALSMWTHCATLVVSNRLYSHED
jgi:hypothetical protein